MSHPSQESPRIRIYMACYRKKKEVCVCSLTLEMFKK